MEPKNKQPEHERLERVHVVSCPDCDRDIAIQLNVTRDLVCRWSCLDIATETAQVIELPDGLQELAIVTAIDNDGGITRKRIPLGVPMPTDQGQRTYELVTIAPGVRKLYPALLIGKTQHFITIVGCPE